MDLLKEAINISDEISQHRRFLHQNPELHLDLPLTSGYVIKKLEEMGYKPERMATSGVVAVAGGKRTGKTFLLRGDMDALPLKEEAKLDFKSENGSMHACGHDFHTSILLGAARLLKNHEDEICGQVKLMFQPAEETLLGAAMMLKEGILENPKVDAAMMLHVKPAVDLQPGSIISLTPEIAYSASDWYSIEVKGTGSHGAMPELGVDPINILVHIHMALQAINSREVAPSQMVTLTTGQIYSGTASNIIPDTGTMTGTIRTLDPNVRELTKKRLVEISQGIASTFRGSAEVKFDLGCPAMKIDKKLNQEIINYSKSLLGDSMVISIADTPFAKNALGSEDFSFVTERVPSTCVNLAAGKPGDGHRHSIHHPKVTFDESALPYGTAVLTNAAMTWLAQNE